MSKRRVLLIGLLVVLALGVAGAVWFARPQKTMVILELTGQAGLAIIGTAEVDGTTQELSGTLPARFVLEGYRVTYSLANAEDSGEVRVKALVGDVALGSSSTGNPPRSGVRGWVKSEWASSWPNHWIESFHKNEDEAWKKPPP